MAILKYELYRYDVALLTANASTGAKEAAASITVDVYREGATARIAGAETGGVGTILLYSLGTIGVGDQIQLGTDSTIKATVDTVDATYLTFTTTAGVWSWSKGDRIVVTNRRPLTYVDDNAVEATTSASQVTTDSSGEATFYSRASVVDMITDDGSSNLSLIADQAGLGGKMQYSPFDWGAAVNSDGAGGGTDDAAALTDQIAYHKANGGGVLELPPGSIRLGSTITFNALTNLKIKGAGRGVTFVDFDHTSTGWDFTGSCSDITIEGITFQRIDLTSAGVDMIQIGSSCNRISINDTHFIHVTGVTSGVGIDDDGTDTRINNVYFTGSTWTNFLRITNTRCHVNSLVGRSGGDWTAGIFIDTTDSNRANGVRLTNVDITPDGAVTGIGILIQDNGAANPPRDISIVNPHIANEAKGTGTNIKIDAGTGIQVVGGLIEAADIGLDMNGGTSVKFIGTNFVDIDVAVDWDGGSHLRFVECDFSDCGVGGGGPAIDVAADLDDMSVIGATGGDYWDASGVFPSPLMDIASGTSDRIQVLGARDDDNSGGIYGSGNNSSKFFEIAHSMVYGVGGAHGSEISFPFVGEAGSQYLNGAETTINPDGTSYVLFDHATGATITSMGTGQTGQLLFMLNIGAGTQTIQAGATIKTSAGGDVTLTTNDTALFIFQGTAWYEMATIGDNG